MIFVSIARRIGAGFGRLRRSFTPSLKPGSARTAELARLETHIAELNRKNVEINAQIEEKLRAFDELIASIAVETDAAREELKRQMKPPDTPKALLRVRIFFDRQRRGMTEYFDRSLKPWMRQWYHRFRAWLTNPEMPRFQARVMKALGLRQDHGRDSRHPFLHFCQIGLAWSMVAWGVLVLAMLWKAVVAAGMAWILYGLWIGPIARCVRPASRRHAFVYRLIREVFEGLAWGFSLALVFWFLVCCFPVVPLALALWFISSLIEQLPPEPGPVAVAA